jgi:nucleoside-diphosphate-sugar epimerase
MVEARKLASLSVDCAARAVGLGAAVFTRRCSWSRRGIPAPPWRRQPRPAPLHVAVGHTHHLCRGHYRCGSFDEIRGVSLTVLVTAAALLVADAILAAWPTPTSTPIVGGALALVLMLGLRHLRRVRHDWAILSRANADERSVPELPGNILPPDATVTVPPSVSVLLDRWVSGSDARDVQISDLLGRQQIDTELGAIAGYLTGRRVLVIGAGGSIGSELCRQIHRFGPAELIMLDRDESALHAVQLSLHGRALLDSPEIILADLRDKKDIRAIFASRQPQVVFHAAALKHLPLLERHPGEAVKTNIWGTLTALECAHGVERFVNISTDKAANPVSVLGYSKRITERLTAFTAAATGGAFLSVRFGNVLGSRGSVLTAFSAQIARGGPITVTHPDVTRYFMTVQEAVHLAIQAAAIGRGGEALVLEMGGPVRIAELARHMANLAPGSIEITYTGLRPGEKLHEDLFGVGEADERPLHPHISHVQVPLLDPAQVRFLDAYADREQLVAALARLCDSHPVSHAAELGRSPGQPATAAPHTA